MFGKNVDYIVGEENLSGYYSKVYGWMFTGLLVTAMISLFAFVPSVLQYFLFNPVTIILTVIAELILVFTFSARVTKMSFTSACTMFLAYSALNGINIGMILTMYDLGVAAKAFFATALMFGTMAVYGKVTKNELSGIGRIAIFGLIGIIIASLINLLFRSSGMDYIISFVSVGIFLVLTAKDSQNIKRIYFATEGNESVRGNLAISAALSLYLDFINIFLYTLRILGRSRD